MEIPCAFDRKKNRFLRKLGYTDWSRDAYHSVQKLGSKTRKTKRVRAIPRRLRCRPRRKRPFGVGKFPIRARSDTATYDTSSRDCRRIHEYIRSFREPQRMYQNRSHLRCGQKVECGQRWKGGEKRVWMKGLEIRLTPSGRLAPSGYESDLRGVPKLNSGLTFRRQVGISRRQVLASPW